MSSESDHSSNVGENDDFSNDSESDHSSKDIENDDYLSDNEYEHSSKDNKNDDGSSDSENDHSPKDKENNDDLSDNEYDHSSKDNKNDDASSDSENDDSLKDENDDSSSDSENDNPLKDKNDDSSSDSENDNSLKDNNDESSSDSEKAHSSNVLECEETQSSEDKYEKLYSKDVTEFIAALKDTNQTMIEQILQKQTEKAEHDHNKNEPFHKYGALLKAACETKCFDSLKNIFKTVLSKKGSDKRRESEELQKLTYFYSEHCVGVEHDSVKTFKDDIVESLKSKISIYLKYAETGDRQPLWLTKVNSGNCTYGLCEGIIYFLY